MKVKVGDKVKVLTGKDKGQEGKVLHTLKNKNRVVVEGVNIVKKHMKPNRESETGGILEVEAPIHASNVKLVDNTKAKKEVKKEVKKETVKEPKKETKTVKKSTKEARGDK